MECSPIFCASRLSARLIVPPPILILRCCAQVAWFATASLAGLITPRPPASPGVLAGNYHKPVITRSPKCSPDMTTNKLPAHISGLRPDTDDFIAPMPDKPESNAADKEIGRA